MTWLASRCDANQASLSGYAQPVGLSLPDDAQSGIPPVHATARWAEQQRGVAVLAAETSPQRSLIIGTVISTALVRVIAQLAAKGSSGRRGSSSAAEEVPDVLASALRTSDRPTGQPQQGAIQTLAVSHFVYTDRLSVVETSNRGARR